MEAILRTSAEKVTFTAAAALENGEVLQHSDGRAVIVCADFASGDLASAHATGQADLAAASGTTFTDGETVYWDYSANLAINGPSGDVSDFPVGKAQGAKVSGTTVVRVLLNATAKPLLYSSKAASTAVTATTAETDFDKFVTIPANSLKPGDVIRVRAQGIVTASNSTDTLAVKLYLGTEEIVTTGAVDVANNDVFLIDATIVIRTIGASGTLVAAGNVALGVEGTVTAKPFKKASATEDMTVAMPIKCTATLSTTNAGNSCRLDVFTVEKLAA